MFKIQQLFCQKRVRFFSNKNYFPRDPIALEKSSTNRTCCCLFSNFLFVFDVGVGCCCCCFSIYPLVRVGSS